MSRQLVSTIVIMTAIVAFGIFATVDAFPRTRTVKDNRRHGYSGLQNAIRNQRPTCDYSVPCGWALYSQRSRSSALRPIHDYTRNSLCQCDFGDECVYKEDNIQMRSYVFYCREASKNRDNFKFPEAFL